MILKTDPANILILVPVDFSEQSLITVEQAHNLARFFGGELMLLHVFEHGGLLSKLFSNESANYLLKKRLKEDLDALAEKTAEKAGVRVHTMMTEGQVWEEILISAERLKCTLIVMSTIPTKSLKRRFIANDTLRVVKEANCPVITIRGSEHREGCRNMVLPLDLTKESKQKVESAIKFAKLFGDTKVHILSVISTGNEKQLNSLIAQINEVKCEIETHGIDCRAEIVKIINSVDSIAQAVIAYSERVNADVIMIMTQKEQNPTEFFIGSSATAIINNSDIPVMSIIPIKEVTSKFF